MTASTKPPESYLPLTPPTFHVLLALADGDKHGYAILKEAAERSKGRVQLNTGTLYAIVKRLLKDGLIREVDSRSKQGDQRRRYYRLTRFGKQVATAEAHRLEGLVSAACHKQLIERTDTA